MSNNPYRFNPTKSGFRTVSKYPDDPNREIPCILYPDNRRELIFGGEELEKIFRYPFRPVAMAMLAPKFRMDLHCVSGMAGYGRIAVVRGDLALWLDEFETVECEYVNGEMHYTAQDDRIAEAPVRVVFLAGRGACGMLIQIDARDLGPGTEVYLVYGGMLGWHTHSPLRLAYNRDMCWGNAVSIRGEYAEIVLDDRGEAEDRGRIAGLKPMPANEGLMSSNRIWKVLDGWKQKIGVRAEGVSVFTAPPYSLTLFHPGHLRSTDEAWGEVVCAKLPTDEIRYAAVGLGEAVRCGDLAQLFDEIRADNEAIVSGLAVDTGIAEFDGAITAAAFPTDGVFGDNVFLHGNLSWREGYQGWRVAYGPLAYGLFGTARKHFENHFHYTRITDGPDKGAFCSTIEDANPGAIAFYNMHQTFLHQARRYWEYSGDGQFAEQLLPVVEGCIERDMRRLKPGDEMLFENCLNTWISDHHWSVMGQCTQASVYLYNIHLLASELSRDPENKAFWRERAEKIKEDLNRVLWQKRKGVFAYAKDLKGYGMLHPEPELADIYHPVELGAADAFQTYQMLDWAEANLDWVRTDNGARMCRSSSWRPNGGNKYSHSIYELNGGEEMNLALAYQEIGLADPAYEIFRFVYMSLYGGRDPGMYDFNYQVGRLRGTPELYTGAALDLPCHLSVNGTSRTNPLFGDTIGMFGREVYEGILGVHPMLQKNEILLAPCIPSEMPHLDMKSALIDYTFDRTDTEIRIRYQVKKSCCTMRFKLFLPVSEVLGVQINGNDAAYTVEPGFGMIAVRTSAENASDGTVEVSFRKADILPTEERRVLSDGDTMELSYPGERIVELIDPQGLFSGVHTEENRLTAQVSAEAGSGVFFLKMRTGKAEYIRPVKVMIREEKKKEVFRGFREEFAAPYEWKTVDMDRFFNYASPAEAANAVIASAERPPEAYSQVNFNYYAWHVSGGFIRDNPLYGLTPDRWRGLVDENGIAVTGEGIPFRSSREGNCMAAATLASPSHPDRIVVPVGQSGRAAYLLITGITLPMQSHVENLRILIRYEDGTEDAHPLINPDGIGDMWFNKFERYHDTPANGFENIGCGRGALSSFGLDLTKPIQTDLEAHILRFNLRLGAVVKEIEMRVIANDVIFALMGITLLA